MRVEVTPFGHCLNVCGTGVENACCGGMRDNERESENPREGKGGLRALESRRAQEGAGSAGGWRGTRETKCESE